MDKEFNIVIEAGKSELHYWKDLWKFRELFLFLAWRDILVRYKQTFFGVAWSVMRPLVTMTAFTVVFGKLAKMPSEGVPYPILVYSALLPWQFFSNAFSDIANSLISNANLLSKIYFPRLIVPASTLIVYLVDFMISLVIFALLMIYFQYPVEWKILFMPLFMLLNMIFCLGLGILIAALNVEYRDFRYVVPFFLQFALYISPVGFSSAVVPEKWKLLYSLNPMVGIIDGFRWCITATASAPDMQSIIVSAAVSILLFIAGVSYFRKTEKTFADVI